MREIVFHVLCSTPGHLKAEASEPPLQITAPTLEDLHHEARDALMSHLGPAHCTYRVLIRHGHGASGIRKLQRSAAAPPRSCC